MAILIHILIRKLVLSGGLSQHYSIKGGLKKIF